MPAVSPGPAVPGRLASELVLPTQTRRALGALSGRTVDPLAELDEVAVAVEHSELLESPWLLPKWPVRVDNAGGGHLLVESLDAQDVDATRRLLRDVGIVGQPEVELDPIRSADRVVRVPSHRREADLVGVEPLGRLQVKRGEPGIALCSVILAAPESVGSVIVGASSALINCVTWSSRRRRSTTSTSSAARHASTHSRVGDARKVAMWASGTPARRSTAMRAWQLKEELRDIFAMGLRAARRALDDWLAYASRSQLAPFVKLARTIRCYRHSIEATIEWKLTNGIAESNNAAIGRLRTNARGFYDPANFITMIMLDRAGIRPGLPWRSRRRGPWADASPTATSTDLIPRRGPTIA